MCDARLTLNDVMQVTPLEAPQPAVTVNVQLRGLEATVVSDPQTARTQLLSLLEYTREKGDRANEAYTLCLLGGCAFFQGNYPETMLFANYSLTISKKEELRSLEARNLNALGLAAAQTSKYAEALEFYMASLQLVHDIGDANGLCRVLSNMASLNSELEDHEKALELYQQAAEAADQVNNVFYIADAKRGTIEELRQLDRSDEAVPLIPEVLELAELYGMKRVLVNLRHSQAMILLEERQLVPALEAAHAGFKAAQEANDYEGLSLMRWMLGECYFNMADYSQAYTEYSKSERLAQAINNPVIESYNKRSLSKLFEVQGELQLSLNSLRAYLEIEHTLRERGMARRTQLLSHQVRAELTRREKELERQQSLELAATHALLEETQSELRYKATHDSLTGTVNRMHFWSKAEHFLDSLPSGGHAGLILADLDDLKDINDTYGTVAGDQLLLEVAHRLTQTVSENDLVSRLSGDEFMILLTSMPDPDAVELVAEKIRNAMRAPFHYDNQAISFSMALGCVSTPGDGTGLPTLHEKAELAIYRAKARGTSQIVRFRPEMSAQEQERRRLKMELPGALKAGQLQLHYQGQYKLPEQTLSGFEALLRWPHPQLGFISPLTFIGLAEESGLILDLGRWVINEACRQAREWNLDERDLTISVNVSSQQFEHEDFVQDVRQALAQHDLPARCLVVEVTETMIHRDLSLAQATILELQHLGVRVAMDDFGTGYSSLSMLRQLPFQQLKIDRTFLQDLTTAADAKQFTQASQFMKAILELARSVDILVVAEGVECSEQLELLSAMGCDEAQGFLLGRPLPADQVSLPNLQTTRAAG
ncbi:EAL domain-containing protein [Deinococcus cavernae]|uniref:EAL domain-containing protein n=2 Tax=Deinococcus cavernae TaxID=2320857 RepID=A0A418V9H8_9DEIO|nr:EAL domain-containing protein [Deinococcus cavernae]